MMERAHLTRLTHVSSSNWQVECLCGWRAVTRLRKEAIAEGEKHWLTSPLVTEVAWPRAN